MVDDDFHAWKSARHLLKHRHLMRRDVKVKDGAQLLRFTPQRVVLLGVQPRRLWMIDRAETHTLKAVLIHPKPQFLSNLGISRIDQPVSDEQLRILSQTMSDVRVVPSVVSLIDQHGGADSKIAHLSYLIFDRCSDGYIQIATALRMIERKLRVERPDFQMRIDDQPRLVSGSPSAPA